MGSINACLCLLSNKDMFPVSQTARLLILSTLYHYSVCPEPPTAGWNANNHWAKPFFFVFSGGSIFQCSRRTSSAACWREKAAHRKEVDPVSPSCCAASARGRAVVLARAPAPLWVTASFLLWSPWKQESVFPSKLSGAPHHIKRRCHDSDCSSTGSLTIAELTAYKAVCRSFNGLRFPIWPSWLRRQRSLSLARLLSKQWI